MDNHLKVEDVFLQIRSVLQANNVKLWLPPYYDQINGPCIQELQVNKSDYLNNFNPIIQKYIFIVCIEIIARL